MDASKPGIMKISRGANVRLLSADSGQWLCRFLKSEDVKVRSRHFEQVLCRLQLVFQPEIKGLLHDVI